MADISKCSNSGCPTKDTCYRHTAPSNPHWQSVSYFDYADGCNFFYPIPGSPEPSSEQQRRREYMKNYYHTVRKPKRELELQNGR